MGLGFDIFKQLDDGSPLWVAEAESLEVARRKLDSLRRSTPGRYFVRNAETGKVIDEADSGKSSAG
jgi:hypothetical protein